MATAEKANVYSKLLSIQTELNVPKNAYNKFGNYSYRNCESILEAIKPFLKKQKAALVVSDDLELIGDRHYVKATARFIDAESGDVIENVAYAREALDVKGMSPAQVTGATSSYARKYALGGLLALDDNKDPDTEEFTEQQNNAPAEKKTTKTVKKDAALPGMNPPEPSDEEKDAAMKASVDKDLIPEAEKSISEAQLKKIYEELKRTGVSEQQILQAGRVNKIEEMSQVTAVSILNRLAKTRSAS
jgi:hypothetical protein